MNEGEVLARARPARHEERRRRPQARALDATCRRPGDPQTITTVVFEYGKVVEVERKVVR